MNQLIELHGKPEALRLDNGSELTSHAFQDWARECGIALRFIQPGKPNQNAYIERFNKTYREEVLSAYLFESIELELPRFGGHVTVLVLDSVLPDFIDLTPQRGLPPPGGRSSGSRPRIAHAPARS